MQEAKDKFVGNYFTDNIEFIRNYFNDKING